MSDRIDNDTWAHHWGVPAGLAATVRADLQRQLFSEWNNPRTVTETGRIPVFPDHLQRPGATGMYLLERMGIDLTPLPPDLQQLISATSCQHRIELWPREGEIPRLVYYDGRLMYAGCCSNLGIAGGRYRHVEGEEITPEERGRARVRFWVPCGWERVSVGLLAVPNDEGGWDWPDTSRPGGYETWADLCEIRFARQQGWRVQVLEKLTWPEARPLDLWAQRLSRLYLRAKEQGNDALAGCFRRVCLHTIGRFHNLGYRDAFRVVPLDDPAATFEAVERIDADGAHLRERVRVDKDPRQVHPEWSAAIWSRCHLKVARALTTLSREALLAVRGDAIYLSDHPINQPESEPWQDDGKAGRLRMKGQVGGPLPAPQSWQELEGLTRG